MIRRLLQHPRFRRHAQQGMRFIICGLLGACIDFGVLALQVEVFRVDPHIAYIPSGLAAITFVFFFNKYVTFKSREAAGKQGLRFALVYSVAFTLNYLLASGLYWVFIRFFQPDSFFYGKAYLLAKAIAIGMIAVLNYILSHGFIFKRQSDNIDMPL